MTGHNRQLLRQFAFREDANAIEGSDYDAALLQGRRIDGGTILEDVEVADVRDGEVLAEHAVREAALGQAAVHRRRTADEDRARQARTGARVLALVTAARRLAVARADTASDALLELSLLHAFR